VALAEQLVTASRRRHELGDLTRAAVEFAELTFEQSRGDLLEAQGELNQAKRALDLLVGGALPETFVATGNLMAPRAGCDRDALLAVMQREHPNVQLLRFAVEQADVGIRSSRARRIPLMDVGARLDVRTPGATLVDGVFTIPLPLFDRRQGEIAAAVHQAELARQRRAEGEFGAIQQVDAVCGEVATAERVLTHIEERVLPLADRRRAQFATEFSLGEIRLEDTLIAARQLLEIQEQALEVVYRHAAARLSLEAATGALSP
jgi:cobalt-zinc-cadmium efflux system outer membrane protein